MNKHLQEFARRTLKDGLTKLPEDCHRRFKLMYARDGGNRSVEDSTAMEINDVVDQMPVEQLDWAMQQIDRTLARVSLRAP